MFTHHFRRHKDVLRRLCIIPFWIPQETKALSRNFDQSFPKDCLVFWRLDRRRLFLEPWRNCGRRGRIARGLVRIRTVAVWRWHIQFDYLLAGRWKWQRYLRIRLAELLLLCVLPGVIVILGRVRLLLLNRPFCPSHAAFCCRRLSRSCGISRASSFFAFVHSLIEQSGLFVCFCHNFHFRSISLPDSQLESFVSNSSEISKLL